MKDFKGKTAIITGGASGIGLAMAEAFGAEGMKLVIADIEQGALETAVASLKARGFEAAGQLTDVAKAKDMDDLAAFVDDTFGKAHLVALNAGVSITGPIWQMSLDDWRWVYDVNVWGVINGIRAFCPRLIGHGEEGHVVITASEAAFVGIGYHAPYCSSKAAAVSLATTLHSELAAANSGIGVSVVCPGFVDTQIHRSWRNRPADDHAWSERERDPEVAAHVDAFQARGVPPEEIARVTLDAVRDERFYVFNTLHWKDMIGHGRDVIVNGEAPPVRTWGPDLRPKAVAAEALKEETR
jgi:NAD(P)-dependent dehydrogenase (short-subunit alcohol dehydrogenase family)